MKFSIKDLFSKCDQISRKLPIWSHLLKKSFTENSIFCAAYGAYHNLPSIHSLFGMLLYKGFISKNCKLSSGTASIWLSF